MEVFMYNRYIPLFFINPFLQYNFVLAPDFDDDMYNVPLYRQSSDNPQLEYINPKKSFTTKEAYKIGESLGIDWDNNPFDVEEYRIGLDVELEHGRINMLTNVSDDNPLITGKIALAHLNEFPDYYTRLSKMEAEADDYWGNINK